MTEKTIEHYQSLMDAVIERKNQPFRGPLACGHEREPDGGSAWIHVDGESHELCFDCGLNIMLPIPEEN